MAENLVISKAGYTSGDCYNGAITERYSWSQTISEIDVKVPVLKDIQKSKDVKVVIESNRIEITLGSSANPHISGNLSHPVVKSECYWNLAPGEAIYIWLCKVQERWWTALLEGEAPIDKSDLEPVRQMEDLPENEQSKIAELMFNEEQKRKGLPTSDELKMQEVLRKAWDAEGSPFKGTPYDPTRVQLGPSTSSASDAK